MSYFVFAYYYLVLSLLKGVLLGTSGFTKENNNLYNMRIVTKRDKRKARKAKRERINRILGKGNKKEQTPQKSKYNNYIHSEEWNIKRKLCFKLKGKACEKCKSTKSIHVHHATYKNFGNEDITNDLYVLCKFCHDTYHGYYSSRKTTIERTKHFIKTGEALEHSGNKNLLVRVIL